MSEIRSWLSNNYTANDYSSDIDTDIAVARRRKALEELRGLLRQKCLQQIDIAIKRDQRVERQRIERRAKGRGDCFQLQVFGLLIASLKREEFLLYLVVIVVIVFGNVCPQSVVFYPFMTCAP